MSWSSLKNYIYRKFISVTSKSINVDLTNSKQNHSSRRKYDRLQFIRSSRRSTICSFLPLIRIRLCIFQLNWLRNDFLLNSNRLSEATPASIHYTFYIWVAQRFSHLLLSPKLRRSKEVQNLSISLITHHHSHINYAFHIFIFFYLSLAVRINSLNQSPMGGICFSENFIYNQ